MSDSNSLCPGSGFDTGHRHWRTPHTPNLHYHQCEFCRHSFAINMNGKVRAHRVRQTEIGVEAK